MKLQLIVPATTAQRHGWRLSLCPPLAPAMLAALTPPGLDVSITDENVSLIDFNSKPDLVGITVLTSTANRAYEIADIFRSLGTRVVLGGIHPSILPNEAGMHADAVVIGEAESTWPALIEDFRSGRLQKVYRQSGRPALTGLPVPRRDLFQRNRYLVPDTISTTRGCPFSCSFCSVSLFSGRTYRCRPVDEVIKEVETIDRRKRVIFVDDNIVGKPDHAKELFKALIPYRLRWFGQASVNIARDDELLDLAAASGCQGLLIGFESIAPESLARMGKRINRIEEYETVAKKLHARGIAIHGAFMFGFDEDDEDIFNRTTSFAKKMRLESVQFGIVIPHPGTALFDDLEKAGRITSKDWSRYDTKVVFRGQSLSEEALMDGTHRALKEFFSPGSIFRRVWLTRHNKLIWLALNIFFFIRFRTRPRAKEQPTGMHASLETA